MTRLAIALVLIAGSAAAKPSSSDPYEASAGLPTPPSIEPAAYAKWLRKQTPDVRQKIEKLCRDFPVMYTAPCGGIGPLRIPIPPDMGALEKRLEHAPKSAGSRAQWEARLTRAQRHYYKTYCRQEAWFMSELCGGTPLAISFDGAPIAFTREPGRFAFVPGDAVATDWITAATPWLALDRDGDGAITSGAELFGRTPDARNGFVALAELDANRDGRIDAADPAFAKLVLWFDRDADRASTPTELVPASSVLDSITLAYTLATHCDVRMNCEGERATVRWHDARGVHAGAIVDVYLAYR